MKTIYKYPLDVTDEQYVSIPKGAAILCVQEQRGNPYLWALVDSELPVEKQRVLIHGTGHPADDVESDYYVGTFQLSHGELVFHVFVGGI